MLFIKKIFLPFTLFFGSLSFTIASPSESLTIGEDKLEFIKIDETKLPKPFDFLLTQPLMTLGLEKYYQRSGKIKIIHAHENKLDNTYSRSILMLMDGKKERNHVQFAEANHEEVAVEFARITMNFKVLPKKVIDGILNSDVPFGKLLATHQIKTYTTGREYFWVSCDAELASLIHCKLHSKLYGRKNILSQEDNKQWLAKVIEILPVVKCNVQECHTV
ncbi:hypothetical protein [Legionella brunensis]|uniref:Uncharacterized protein n=1 Tax=Legionella brunensis TaxID=29422 RepID=A0A0W0SUF4_9GAMM|nr:hypothetical protein [Legionella brunensis]KTC87018.1 hypothetical protein Lbru_0247 [Legionella brunensis]